MTPVIEVESVRSGDTVVVILRSAIPATPSSPTRYLQVIGTAKRNSADPFNEDIGFRLAYGRALKKLGTVTYRSGWDMVRKVDGARAKHREMIKARRSSAESTSKTETKPSKAKSVEKKVEKKKVASKSKK